MIFDGLMINNHGSFSGFYWWLLCFTAMVFILNFIIKQPFINKFLIFPRGNPSFGESTGNMLFFCWEVLKQIQDNELNINTLHWHVNHVGLELVDQRFRWAKIRKSGAPKSDDLSNLTCLQWRRPHANEFHDSGWKLRVRARFPPARNVANLVRSLYRQGDVSWCHIVIFISIIQRLHIYIYTL